MPKRQKAKIPSARTTIERTTSPAKLARIERQNAQEATNKDYPQTKPWDLAKAARLIKRQLNGKTQANWRKANASSIGEKPSVSNTKY